MRMRTSLAGALAAALSLAPVAPAGASESLLVIRGSGPGSATLVVPRLLRIDLETLRSSGCGAYSGLSFHGVPHTERAVTALRIGTVDTAGSQAARPFPPVVVGGRSLVALTPGSYRVDLHAERACSVAVRTRGLHAPWVTTVSPGAAETFHTSVLDPVGPATAGVAQWPIPAGAKSTVVVTVAVRPRVGTGTFATVMTETDACAGSAPQVCVPAQDEAMSTVTSPSSANQAQLVATRYVAGDAPVEPAWASGRVAGPYVTAAVAMLSTG